MSKRLTFLDYTKGFAILCLLLSHSIPGEGMLKTWIFAFHMPIFFVICGYLGYLKYPNGLSIKDSIGYLKRRERSIFEPYIVFGLLLIVFFVFIDYLSTQNISLRTYKRIITWATLGGIESMWFLPVYFFAEYLFLLLRHFISSRYLNMFVGLIFLTFCIGGDDIISQEYAQLKRILVGLLFVFGGYVFARYQLAKYFNLVTSVIIIIICSLFSLYLGFASMIQMVIPSIYIFDGVMLSIAFISLFNILELYQGNSLTFLLFWGTNSLIVLCTNNLLIEIIRLLDYKITANIMLHSGVVGDLIFFLILTILEIPIIKVLQGKFPRK